MWEPLREVRDAVRACRRAPFFTAGVVAVLALGIGANGAVFSILRAVLLQPLPYRSPDRVVMLWQAINRSENWRMGTTSRVVMAWPRSVGRRARGRRVAEARADQSRRAVRRRAGGSRRAASRRARLAQLLRSAGRRSRARPRVHAVRRVRRCPRFDRSQPRPVAARLWRRSIRRRPDIFPHARPGDGSFVHRRRRAAGGLPLHVPAGNGNLAAAAVVGDPGERRACHRIQWRGRPTEAGRHA